MMKPPLRKLRRWVRKGNPSELDLDDTISSTARQGWLDVKLRPERHNGVKLLVFFDVGGSMDAHVAEVQRLFSALRHEFKHLVFFYFHNCLYDFVWKDNERRFEERFDTLRLLRTYGTYKTMSLMAHQPPKTATKPQFVHRPAIKEEFFRRTNVSCGHG
mgnify:CR=1 FL=1